MMLIRLVFYFSKADIQQFYHQREGHAEIHVALVDFNVYRFEEQQDSNAHKEDQRQHFYRWVLIDKIADITRKEYHYDH
jgi:hypothetical protein